VTGLVVDASAVVALLVDAGPAGEWVDATVAGSALYAPDLLPYEVGNVLRRHAAAGRLDATAVTLAHADLVALALDLYPYAAVADRVWELRASLSAYDASYVGLAELLELPLITLDGRLARAAGPRCPIVAYAAPM
jgi:predicted nucleic acid-binding protein